MSREYWTTGTTAGSGTVWTAPVDISRDRRAENFFYEWGTVRQQRYPRREPARRHQEDSDSYRLHKDVEWRNIVSQFIHKGIIFPEDFDDINSIVHNMIKAKM